MKTCSKCKSTLDLSMFGKSSRSKDGLQTRCKSCISNIIDTDANRKYMREYMHNRYANDGRFKKHVKNRESYVGKKKQQLKARVMVYQAILKGKLVKGNCSNCGSSERIHGHHADYSKPLDVIWLCSSCHRKLHVKNSQSESK